MIEFPEVVAYGRPATQALARCIAAAKSDGALQPVTVIVPSNFVGLSARRLLGSDLLDAGQSGSGQSGSGQSRSPGIVNVSFVTPFRLAERLASDMLLSESPLTNPVLGAAVRRALATNPGIYRDVREHHSTEVALAALFAELSNVDEPGLEAIETGGEAGGKRAVDFYRSIKSHLGGFHTEKQLASAAADRPDLVDLVADLGHVIWFLPAPMTAAMSRLVGRALSDASSASVIVGVSGDEEADKPIWDACYSADVVEPKIKPDLNPATADAIVSVTDADEEVRSVIRGVLDLLDSGVRADRIGVFYPAPDPYVRMIAQQFAAAGIAANGPDRRRLGHSVAGRTLLSALKLGDTNWRRDKVMALVSGGPIRHEDGRAHPSAWETLSRQAGIHQGINDWSSKLSLEVDRTKERLAKAEEEGEASTWYQQRLTDRIGDAESLASFVNDLQEKAKAVDSAKSWPTKCETALELLHSLMGPEQQHSFWPESEQDAFGKVVDALTRFVALDAMEPSPSTAVFQRALASELDVARNRNGRFGQGVLYGPLSAAVGHDLDAVFIVGCAEGLLPAPRRDDALLPDRVRKLALDQIELKLDRLHHQHREFLAALGSAPAGSRILTFPRGDLRSSRTRLPSRWLLDTATALAGEDVRSTGFAEVADSDDVPEIAVVSSHATGVRKLRAAMAEDRDMAEIAEHIGAGGQARDHPLSTSVGLGLEMQQARRSDSFTAFDGNLAGQPIPGMDTKPASASRWETWAGCGFKFYLAHILELSERDDPESIDKISPLDRGNLMHRILELFIGAALEEGWLPEPTTKWDAKARERLVEIAHTEFDGYEARGRTGRSIHWVVEKNDLLALLDSFLATDEIFRAANGATPISIELPFGLKEKEALEIELPAAKPGEPGRTLRFRGLADRVDMTTSGRVIVSDYKTGKSKKYKDLDDDPVQEGKTLQLGLYAEAALRETGAHEATSAYWMLEAGDKDTRLGYKWDEEKRSRFLDVLSTITDGIEGGIFAAEPGEWVELYQVNEACRFCDFDSLCPSARGEQAEAKAATPELVAIRASLSGEEE